MKDVRNGEALQRDQELRNMVTASIASPALDGLNLLTTLVPGFDYSHFSQIFASYATTPTPGSRFQLHPLIPQVPSTFAALPTPVQYDILPWLNEQDRNGNNKGENNIKNKNNNNASTVDQTLYKKRGTSNSVKKTSRKSKSPLQNGLAGFEQQVAITTEMDHNEVIKPTLIPIDNSSNTQIKSKTKRDLQRVELENNNNNHHNNQNKNMITEPQQPNPPSRSKSFTCETCHRSFGYKHVLQNHERTHTGEKPYSCNLCDKKFTRDHHLKTHMRLHTGEKPYNCQFCDKQFVQVANLRRHVRVHTGEKPYNCKECHSCFSDSNQLKAHVLIHQGQKPYFCPHCELRFRRRHHLTNHKCMTVRNNRAFPPSPDISPPASKQRERKARSTRRIVRLCDMPVSTVTSTLIPTIPMQTHPEDLSLGSSNGLRNRQFSGSHSSANASASTSPASRGSQGSIVLFSPSGSSEQLLSDEERSGSGESINCSNGKHDSDELPSPSQG